jgi:hypothetical protein
MISLTVFRINPVFLALEKIKLKPQAEQQNRSVIYHYLYPNIKGRK